MSRYFRDKPFNHKGRFPSMSDQLKETFTLTCNKCGSSDCVFDYKPEYAYSELTVDPARLSFGCNACKENDFHA